MVKYNSTKKSFIDSLQGVFTSAERYKKVYAFEVHNISVL